MWDETCKAFEQSRKYAFLVYMAWDTPAGGVQIELLFTTTTTVTRAFSWTHSIVTEVTIDIQKYMTTQILEDHTLFIRNSNIPWFPFGLLGDPNNISKGQNDFIFPWLPNLNILKSLDIFSYFFFTTNNLYSILSFFIQ